MKNAQARKKRHSRIRCEVGLRGRIVLVCPAKCPCTIERQRVLRDIEAAIWRYVEARRRPRPGPEGT